MEEAFSIRDYFPADEASCVSIYRDAVRNGTAPFYTPKEAAAWAPQDHDPAEWTGRLGAGRTWIADTASGPQGFITLAQGDHLDLFFVRPAARRLGLAPALYERLLAEARRGGAARLTTHASHLARRFLERRGWTVMDEERNLRHGVWLTRFRMELAVLAVPGAARRPKAYPPIR